MGLSTRQQSIPGRDQVTDRIGGTDGGTASTDSARLASSATVRLGRLLYGGVLGVMAVNGLQNADAQAEYAEAKGVPAPWFANVYAHLLLLAGAVGITLWRWPRAAASTVATFFVAVTPMMHDFWSVDDEERAQQEQLDFLKNVGLLGAALVFRGIARRSE